MSVSIINEERETTCNFDYITKEWRIWSNVPKHINRMKKLGYSIIREDTYGTAFTVPERAIRFAATEKHKREMTDEQKRAASERLALARTRKANSSFE